MNSNFAALTPLLAPRSVAVIGASNDPRRIGGRPLAYMIERGFSGRIMPVNPNRSSVQGLAAYPDIASLPEVPDVAVVAVAAAHAVASVAALARAGTRAAIVLSAGFAEVDAAGAAMQARMVAAARAGGMRLLGPNCLGLFNAPIGFFPIFSASFEGGWPRPPRAGWGHIGIATQSGAYGTHLFALARNRGMATPLCVTTGNEADVTLAEVIGWMAEDPATDVIAAYSEGIRDGARLIQALDVARVARKPVVMMKVGASALGRSAAQSHTASIAGDDAVTSAVLAEFGVIRARNTEELLDIAYAATRRIYPADNTLGVITVSGGAGVLISDVAETLGLPMPPMPAEAQARLRELVGFCAPANPVDCTAQAFNDLSLIGRFTASMVEDGGYRSVLAFFTQVGGAPSIAPRLRTELGVVKAAHPDRLYALSVIAPPAMVAEYEADGFLVFEDPTRATVALHAMGVFGAAFDAVRQPPPHGIPGPELPPGDFTEARAKTHLAAWGIPPVPEHACADATQAVAAARRFGFPVVLKILSPDIPHKSEIGGVLLNVGSDAEIVAGYAMLMARAAAAAPLARIEGVLVARQLRGGVECIMGIVVDPVFGPMAMFGLGGIFVEVLRDVVLRRCPFDHATAEAMIRSIRAAPLLTGARGREPADIVALATMLSRLSLLADRAGPALLAIDLNPVLAMPEGQGAFVADAVIEMAKPG